VHIVHVSIALQSSVLSTYAARSADVFLRQLSLINTYNEAA